MLIILTIVTTLAIVLIVLGSWADSINAAVFGFGCLALTLFLGWGVIGITYPYKIVKEPLYVKAYGLTEKVTLIEFTDNTYWTDQTLDTRISAIAYKPFVKTIQYNVYGYSIGSSVNTQ